MNFRYIYIFFLVRKKLISKHVGVIDNYSIFLYNRMSLNMYIKMCLKKCVLKNCAYEYFILMDIVY